jgi:hypothetical protein
MVFLHHDYEKELNKKTGFHQQISAIIRTPHEGAGYSGQSSGE